jgi:hypothetical protein
MLHTCMDTLCTREQTSWPCSADAGQHALPSHPGAAGGNSQQPNLPPHTTWPHPSGTTIPSSTPLPLHSGVSGVGLIVQGSREGLLSTPSPVPKGGPHLGLPPDELHGEACGGLHDAGRRRHQPRPLEVAPQLPRQRQEQAQLLAAAHTQRGGGREVGVRVTGVPERGSGEGEASGCSAAKGCGHSWEWIPLDPHPPPP